MEIVEIFKSIQGEGTLIGTKMVFIRLWGCNMSCIWCDTRYSWATEYKKVTSRKSYLPEKLAIFLNEEYKDVLWMNFTGGEPSLWSDQILETLPFLNDKKTCIQTNGKTWNKKLFNCLDKVCMDFKCPESGETSNIEYLNNLREQDEAKFVIGNENDLIYAKNIISSNETNATIIVQPVLSNKDSFDDYYNKIRWLIKEFEDISSNNIRILPQYHQLLWRDKQGT